MTESGVVRNLWAARRLSRSVILESAVVGIRLFLGRDEAVEWPGRAVGMEARGGVSTALRDLRTALDPRLPVPSDVRSTPGTTGRSAPLP